MRACPCCGNMLGASSYPETKSPFFPDGHLTICGNCLDEQLVDVNSAKRVFSQTLGVAGERDPQVREQMNQLINQLLTDETMNKFKTGVHYGYSTTPGVGRGFVSLFKEDGTRAATLNMGLQKNLDKVVGMNQWAPQVIYSKIVLAELTKVMENYRTGSGKFELTPELQKILNG